jgi:2-polyprenyl-6-methoxyphenol hydroxylase-like FAD-dependent oxidoreductase
MTLTTTCCIVGGGPAGMMLGFLLARAGIDVTVLEKHSDFLRDFRGDTIHPSTMELLAELGLLDQFLERPHSKAVTLSARIGSDEITVADFSHLPTRCRFIAFMPQWEFLDFLSHHARIYSSFHLLVRTEATGTITEADTVRGVRAQGPDGELIIRANLVVAADGRNSTLRDEGGFKISDLGAPMDVLWMRLSRNPTDRANPLGTAAAGRLFIAIDRGDYWQCAYLVPKGGFDSLKAAGLQAFRTAIAELAPAFADRVQEIATWDDVKLLTVTVNRVREWFRPGLLLIGDAAHAMSPVGGVGINLAIQDAVASANILAPHLRNGPPGPELLRLVQRRRETPTRLTQGLQLLVQNAVIRRVLAGRSQPQYAPLPLRLLAPATRYLVARIIGLGFLPEHIRSLG